MRLEEVCVSELQSIREVLERIDASGMQLALVVAEDLRLIGTVSDGDIRRGLLRGVMLDSPVLDCVNRSFQSVPAGTPDAEVLKLLKLHKIHQMPVVSESGRVVDLLRLEDLIDAPPHNNIVVLMAGGLGQRLGDLTRTTPKPMLPVGGRPLLETIVGNFRDQGFRRFRLAVNFKSEVIEGHFGDGSQFDCEIDYLREPKRLGTAGALSLLADRLEEPILVANGDLMLRADYRAMLERHLATGVEATMAVREFEYQVPYGVIKSEGDRILQLEEKPVQRFLISGGLYVLSPEAVTRVPRDTFFDMPNLFDDILAAGGSASAYPIDGYWLDIGHHADYEQAQREFTRVFPSG